jgi:outer membrane lipoprotein SlyB
MDTPINRPTAIHPTLAIAALAVILFCGVGIAAIMGWLPSSIGGNSRATMAAPLQLADNAVQRAPAPAAPRAGTDSSAPTAGPEMIAPDRRADGGANTELAAADKPRCANCGNIESTREITTRGQGSGVGAAGGAVLGGLLGNQLGGGHGRQLATVAGAVGGAVVGNQVEGNMNAKHSYEIRVRLDDGSLRVFHQSSRPGWHAGERVKIVGGSLHHVG